jgi:hypothetical protein
VGILASLVIVAVSLPPWQVLLMLMECDRWLLESSYEYKQQESKNVFLGESQK